MIPFTRLALLLFLLVSVLPEAEIERGERKLSNKGAKKAPEYFCMRKEVIYQREEATAALIVKPQQRRA